MKNLFKITRFSVLILACFAGFESDCAAAAIERKVEKKDDFKRPNSPSASRFAGKVFAKHTREQFNNAQLKEFKSRQDAMQPEFESYVKWLEDITKLKSEKESFEFLESLLVIDAKRQQQFSHDDLSRINERAVIVQFFLADKYMLKNDFVNAFRFYKKLSQQDFNMHLRDLLILKMENLSDNSRDPRVKLLADEVLCHAYAPIEEEEEDEEEQLSEPDNEEMEK